MVEHQTENLGVRGSIPFTGKIIKYFLIYIYIRNYLVKLTKKRIILNSIISLDSYKLIVWKDVSSLRDKNSLIKTYSCSNLLWFLKKLKHIGNLNKTYKTIYWISWLLKSYLYDFINNSIYWKFVNISITNHYKIFIKFWKTTFKKSLLKNFKTSAWYHYYILVQFYFTRSIADFSKLVQLILNKSGLKKHKRLFYLAGNILIDYFVFLQSIKRIEGFNIYFKGKLGRKGSVKKSTIYIHRGKKSLSSKSLKYSYRNFLVFTETGVVGCYFSIFF